MSELREVAEAIVQEARESFPVCPSPFGCEYCEAFGCPRDPRPVHVTESAEGVHIWFESDPGCIA